MKKQLLFFLLIPLSGLYAQDYVPLQVTSGFTADVIADGIGPSANSTTIAVDAADFNFMSADFQANDGDTPPEYALPVSGLIESTAISGLTYQFAPYYENNSLRIESQDEVGSLTFANPVMATTVYIMACTGSGSGTIIGNIYFSDGTYQEIASVVVPDWFYSNALPVITSGFGRVNRVNDVIENPVGNPRLYQVEIAILPENQSKLISSMDFTKTSTAQGIVNIFAVSAHVLGTCPSPTEFFASSTADGAGVSWTPAPIAPASGYDYYYTTDSTEPSDTQTPSGNVNASTTYVSLSGLATGQHYYFWVRSNCSASDRGLWQLVEFTTGQQETTYPDGDINTLYIDAADVNAESENTCPGLLYVDVPPGYKITSTAVSYDMQTASNGWKSEQRSILVCNTSGLKEDSISQGTGGSGGTQSYFRDGLSIANDLTGTVEFELRAWRTYGGTDCNPTWNRVLGDTFKVTITYEPLLNTENTAVEKFAVYPNPVQNTLNISAKENITEVRLYNMLGQEISHKAGMNSKEMTMDTSNLANGTYIVKVETQAGVNSLKIIRE
ncbi:T9SS type A sorting domain-containing protein [Flavobacterium pallidum]|uniref:Fibronectin type-III domain-containing protein n=1 Tax=Flavobacterium pallidum TaxID=2172098 RepID=A0A2S1SGL6_9FLAO|nr:T9SS type A sorting domain-containing protein [Flavobacterium pallidum]AWI25525.1 hypothetical protein HYN49_06225 [Flavobacterium pallidum]